MSFDCYKIIVMELIERDDKQTKKGSIHYLGNG